MRRIPPGRRRGSRPHPSVAANAGHPAGRARPGSRRGVPDLPRTEPAHTRTADRARPTARRTACHGHARVVRTELDCATLVSRGVGSAARPCPPSDARRAGARLDGAGACALSAMSRPSFARNFERALGQSPMQYLTDWRLTLARDYLLAGELTWNRSPIAPATAPQRFRRDIPPTRWTSTRPVAATALIEAVGSSLGAFSGRE